MEFKTWFEAVRTHHFWRQNDVLTFKVVQDAIKESNNIKELRTILSQRGISFEQLQNILRTLKDQQVITIARPVTPEGKEWPVLDGYINIIDPEKFKALIKDPLGKPAITEPGFGNVDKKQILEAKERIEAKLDKATSRLGVHWIVMYLEPKQGTPETQYPAKGGMPEFRRRAEPYWQDYSKYAQQTSQLMIQKLAEEDVLPPASPNNTIAYIKPTSRVHNINDWQQMHNIGHAVWGHAKKHLAKFTRLLQDLFTKLDAAHAQSTGKKANWVELVVMLGRLLNVKSFQRVFNPKQDFTNLENRANTALNNFMEAMFEMIATYLNNGGKITLTPRAEVLPGKNASGKANLPTPDRTGQMEPNPAIAQTFSNVPTRPATWGPMTLTPQDLQIASEGLTKIIDEAILDCVYAKAGPIYATRGYFSTKP